MVRRLALLPRLHPEKESHLTTIKVISFDRHKSLCDKIISMEEKKPRYKPRFAIDGVEISKIEAMSGIGLTLEEIAAIYGVSADTLRTAFRKNDAAYQATIRGRALAKQNVSKTVYDMAVSGKHPTMTQFWLKCRAGWKETTVHELEISAQQNQTRDVIEVSKNDRDNLLKVMLELRDLPDNEPCKLIPNS